MGGYTGTDDVNRRGPAFAALWREHVASAAENLQSLKGNLPHFGKPPGNLEMKILDDNDQECPPGVLGEICSRPTDGTKAKVEYFENAEASAAKVTGRIVEQGRHPKVLVMKYKRTNQYRITRGHRQNFTAIEVKDITV